MYKRGLRGDAACAASSRRRCSTCACPACRSGSAGCARSPTCSATPTARSSRTPSARPTRSASLDRCADVPLLRAVVRPPEDPATRARVAELRRRLAELKARFDAGPLEGGAEGRAPALVAEARALGYQPLVAETLALIGHDVRARSNDAQGGREGAGRGVLGGGRLSARRGAGRVGDRIWSSSSAIRRDASPRPQRWARYRRGGAAAARRPRAAARLAAQQSRRRLRVSGARGRRRCARSSRRSR